ISITGITGTAAPKIADIETAVSKLRKITKLPVAVGFGITTPEQAGQIGKTADGVIVGSAVVRLIDENRNSPDLIKIVADFTGALKKELQ
ncbi:MAG: tryptophan synthase subunit alpha, partial [Smithellaceae bacterium]